LKREDHGKEVVGSETGDTVCSRRTPKDLHILTICFPTWGLGGPPTKERVFI
jgi:hypothetical protein